MKRMIGACKRLGIFCIQVCYIQIAMGQQLSIIPPAPEAAALFKSTDVPVSLYSGLPGIGVNFYTIKTKELQIPIEINYNARGIQVAEIASRTGIGWALQSGGKISRQIRGSADELYYGIFQQANYYYNDVFKNISKRASLWEAYVQFGQDMVPDLFYFDINGRSGKFIINHIDKKVVLQKFADLTIEPNIYGAGLPTQGGEGIVSWVVTDESGNKYYYGQSKDGTRQAADFDVVNNYAYIFPSSYEELPQEVETRPRTTWHLMEIETALHERIEFFYEEEQGVYYRRNYDRVIKGRPDEVVPQETEIKCFFSQIESHQFQIKQINFPGGKLLFDKESAKRKDFPVSHALKTVSVKDTKDSLVKKYEFDYFYQRCNEDNNQLAHLRDIDTSAKYRLFLSSVKESSKASSLPPYQFEYNSTKLPNRFSNSQDNWGFYNGKPNGQYLTFFTYINPISRVVDTALCGAGLLEKITYPTGGTTALTYEQNRVIPPWFMDVLLFHQNNPSSLPGGEWYGAGKRIKRIEQKDAGKGSIIKEYEYTDGLGSTTGKMLGLPAFHYIQQMAYIDGDTLPIIDQYGSVPGSPLTQLQGNSVGYAQVTEYFGEKGKNQGKTVHHFTIPDDAGGEYYKFPYHIPIDYEWLRGKPSTTQVYENKGGVYELKKTIDNTYLYAGSSNASTVFDNPFRHVDSVYVYRNDRRLFDLPLMAFKRDFDGPGDYDHDVYYQTAGTFDLASTVEKEYDNGNEISKTTIYEYDYDKHYQPITQKTINSLGDTITIRKLYPRNFPGIPVYDSMVKRNMMAPVIEQTTFKNTTEIGKVKTNYAYWNNKAIIVPDSIKKSVLGNALETELVYSQYDKQGNPCQYTEKDGIPITILWGYQHQYPVAKIVGATLATVLTKVDTATLRLPADDLALRTLLQPLRTLPKTLVTTYTYQPLIGMTSATDPNGNTVYYQYDYFGRLDLVRDQDSNIIKKYCYNYAGQPENCVTTYSSAVKFGSFKPNNCPSGSTGDWMTYTVAAGTYTSTISQADANQKAQNDVTANGQAYANANGICKMPIYATLEVDFFPTSIFNGNCVEQYKDVLVYFYKDAARTIPYSVSNLTIQIKRGRTGYSNGSAGPTTYTTTSYVCNGNTFTLPGQLTLEGCASGCPEGFNCLPKQNDPHVKYTYDLVDAIFYITL
jgi:YD repeat-containing protein